MQLRAGGISRNRRSSGFSILEVVAASGLATGLLVTSILMATRHHQQQVLSEVRLDAVGVLDEWLALQWSNKEGPPRRGTGKLSQELMWRATAVPVPVTAEDSSSFGEIVKYEVLAELEGKQRVVTYAELVLPPEEPYQPQSPSDQRGLGK